MKFCEGLGAADERRAAPLTAVPGATSGPWDGVEEEEDPLRNWGWLGGRGTADGREALPSKAELGASGGAPDEGKVEEGGAENIASLEDWKPEEGEGEGTTSLGNWRLLCDGPF